MTITPDINELLIALKERHELAMVLMYDANDTTYFSHSRSGQITKLLEKYGITVDVPQKLI